MPMKIDVDAAARLRAIVKREGSQRNAAKHLDISEVYICDLLKGRRDFSENILAKLGLRRTVIEANR